MIQRVAVIKFRVNNRCGSGTGSFEVKIGADRAKFTNVIITRLKERWYLVRESEMTVEDETKVPSWISGIEWAVVNFSWVVVGDRWAEILFWKSLTLTGWQSSKRICVAEHFEDEQQMSQSQVGEKTGKVVWVVDWQRIQDSICILSRNFGQHSRTDAHAKFQDLYNISGSQILNLLKIFKSLNLLINHNLSVVA